MKVEVLFKNWALLFLKEVNLCCLTVRKVPHSRQDEHCHKKHQKRSRLAPGTGLGKQVYWENKFSGSPYLGDRHYWLLPITMQLCRCSYRTLLMRMSLRDLQLLLGAKLSIPVSEVTYLVIWEFLKTEQKFETFGRKNASLSKSKRPPIPIPLRISWFADRILTMTSRTRLRCTAEHEHIN